MTITFPTNARGPILDLTLPASEGAVDIVLRNATTGKTLTINLPEGWSGDDLTLDFYRQTIKDQTGGDRSSLLSPTDNELWVPAPLVAGVNDVEIEVLGAVLSQTKSPGKVENDATHGDVAWTNPSNAKASDNTYAKVTLKPQVSGTEYEESQGIYPHEYGFAIPTGSEILGIGLDIECFADFEAVGDDLSGASSFAAFYLQSSGLSTSRPGNEPGGFWGQVESIRHYGGLGDLWTPVFGGPIEPADVNHATFGPMLRIFQFAGAVVNCFIDHMPLTVHYRAAPAAYNATATLRCEMGYY